MPTALSTSVYTLRAWVLELTAVSYHQWNPTPNPSVQLATAIPEDGGGIVWVERAFGWTFGLHNGWWTYVAWVFDCSIYPALASFYAGVDDPIYRGFIAIGIIWVVIAIKLCGLQYMEKLSEWMGLASLIPCTIW
jgi:amino acid transporter